MSGQSTHACISWEDPGFPEEQGCPFLPFCPGRVSRTPPLPGFHMPRLCERSEFQKGKTMMMGRVTWGCVSLKARSSRWQRKPEALGQGYLSSLLFTCFPFHCLLWTTLFISPGIFFFFPSPLIYYSTKFRSLCAIPVFEANVQFWNYLASKTDTVKIAKEKSQTFRKSLKLIINCAPDVLWNIHEALFQALSLFPISSYLWKNPKFISFDLTVGTCVSPELPYHSTCICLFFSLLSLLLNSI